MRGLLSLFLLAFLGAVQALSVTGNRLLVVTEEAAADKQRFSSLFTDLEARGYKISIDSPKNDKLSLFNLGERVYDHILLLPPKSKGLGPALTPNVLLQFINSAGNILFGLVSGAPTPSAISSLLLELDIQVPPERNSLVVDHFNYDSVSASEKHDVLLLPQPGPVRADVKNYFGGDGILALPRAVGQVLGPDSALLSPLLKAPSTAYAYNTKEEAEGVEDPFAVGQQLSLVSTMQARNSARVTVLGSLEMLENKWFEAKVKTAGKGATQSETANREFAKQLTAWTFHEIGVLKADRMQHLLSETVEDSHANTSLSTVGDLNPTIYRVKNDVTFSIELSEYVYDHYVPFVVPEGDSLQLEFSMLSPFHRLPLTPSSTTETSTIFSTSFTVPDQHGIFTFRVNYKRPFLTNVDEKQTVTVRHFAHDEFPRSWRISGGWVWIAGIWTVVVGWLAFLALWLWSEPVKEVGVKKTQ